nr:uncharacterized protein LOC108950046 [Ciona intestinalis]|eukprot:XP_026692150.1 uncharacterized protein LOC108950046 [Ciona intestinalis]
MLTEIALLYTSMLVAASVISILICGSVVSYHVCYSSRCGKKNKLLAPSKMNISVNLPEPKNSDNWLSELISRDLGQASHGNSSRNAELEQDVIINNTTSLRGTTSNSALFTSLTHFLLATGYILYGAFLINTNNDMLESGEPEGVPTAFPTDTLCSMKYLLSFLFHISALSSVGTSYITRRNNSRYRGLCSFIVILLATLISTTITASTMMMVGLSYLPNVILILFLRYLADNTDPVISDLQRYVVLYPLCDLADTPSFKDSNEEGLETSLAAIVLFGAVSCGCQLYIALFHLGYFTHSTTRNRRYENFENITNDEIFHTN